MLKLFWVIYDSLNIFSFNSFIFPQKSTNMPSSSWRSSFNFSTFLYSVLYFKQSTDSGAFVHSKMPASSTLAHFLFSRDLTPHFSKGHVLLIWKYWRWPWLVIWEFLVVYVASCGFIRVWAGLSDGFSFASVLAVVAIWVAFEGLDFCSLGLWFNWF